MFDFNSKKKIKDRIEAELQNIKSTVEFYETLRKKLASSFSSPEEKKQVKFELTLIEGRIKHSLLEVKHELNKL